MERRYFEAGIRNKSLHGMNNDNGVRVVKFATPRNITVKSTMFSHHGIHKYAWISPNWEAQNQIDHILMDKTQSSNTVDVQAFRGAGCDIDKYLVTEKLDRLSVSK